MGIRNVLAIPHFSHTKRLDLIHEQKIPIIFSNNYLVPSLCMNDMIFRAIPAEQTKRMFYTMCSECFENELHYHPQLDLLKCSYCGKEFVYEEPINYKRSSRRMVMARRFSSDFYKRVVHFRFWLKRIQGKEKNKVTAKVVQDVADLLIKDNCRGVHYWVIRNALKRLGYQEFYDNSVYIMSRIRGTPLVSLTKNQETVLVQMFMELEQVFSSLRHSRVNMLSYPYVIKKLCELKGWNAMARIIPTLKSHTRIILQDELWRKICEQKQWRFIPTAQWTSLETRAPNGTPH